MGHGELLETNNAMVWAAEFVRSMKTNKWTLEDIDEGLMVGWFANAMRAQEFVMSRKMTVEKFTNLMPTLDELVKDGIKVRLPTVEEIADDHIQEMMDKEKGI